jgi:hypothetical protein
MKKTFVGLAATMVATGGLGLAGLGLASGTAQAEPGFVPLYHWCPGDFWDPGWGDNWEWGGCHDDFHRDADGWDHSRDWRPDQGPGWQPWGDRGWNQGGERGWDHGGDRGWDQGGDHDRGGGPAQPWWPGH